MQVFRSHTRSPRWQSLLPVCLVVVFSAISLPRAQAGFIGDYALANFTLTNINGNGFATTPDGGVTLVLTGPNNGSDLAGTTDLTITAPASGLVQFQYLYSSLDAPTFDFAGYLRGAAFTQLADTDGQSGSVVFSVNSGQMFGFRVGTADNTGEPGVLKIFDFTGPGSAGNAVPEPGTWSLFPLAGAIVFAARKLVRAAVTKEKNA